MKLEYIKDAEKMRYDWAQKDAVRDEGLTDRTDIRTEEDILYVESESEDDENWHLMDLYYPKKVLSNNEKYPVIVSVHGGGWFYGDKKLYRHYCMKLSSYGYAVVNFNYRLCPEYQYPNGFMDVCQLMNYISNNADIYQLDMDNLFAVGDSAGAQLLSQYCVWATNSDYHALLDKEGIIKAPVPKKIALNCGVYDMRAMFGREELFKWYLTDEDLENPMENTDLRRSFFGILDHITSDFPETYLMLSVNDPLKVHTQSIKDKFDETGVVYVFKEWGEGSPADGHVFHVNLKSSLGEKCNDEEIAFFKGLL